MIPSKFLLNNKRQLSASSKVWKATIRMPEFRPSMALIPPIFDIDKATESVIELIQQHNGQVLVITGAGISTDSGIPDYRGESGTYIRNPKHRPILYHELTSSEQFRQRYWARGFLGWNDMVKAKPNPSHVALSSLLEANFIQNIITQNVDHLHHFAGTNPNRIIELHGTLHLVECMVCKHSVDRTSYQHRLIAHNPSWADYQRQLAFKGEKPMINPDGDVDLPGNISYENFSIPTCTQCSSTMMKPKVIFFGESIPKSIHQAAESMVYQAKAVLVIGSSLATYSSYRLVRLAKELGKPIGLLTSGATRADDISHWKAYVRCMPVLERVVSHLLETS
ncbi:DHS-like NAD/FAD-binding domain-containing protein [Halteromyces radiatus]|uniref:DHS-like NAD/FAD-binding domain-containing protein n=1 Tax=Halteromyces radiatus TaxID=101107 RepID=UPI00221F7731|nr:DHS-like NAD/FAD-binding domain-containing protein [Halteromyces radiatus]KAI8096841.1 DHS-like NAD/FAD-binding domain-containing protein [Halteromyces radiatus]